MARILFVHNNFPAQFRMLAEALPGRGHSCAAIASETGKALPGAPVAKWKLKRGTSPGLFTPATRAEADLLRGAAAAEEARKLKAGGFEPDLIIAHPGWGETIFLRQIFPSARQILYGEFYYRPTGADLGFDPEFGQPPFEEVMRVHAKNATGLLAYADADVIVSPTAFQGSLYPPLLADRIRILHEGVDTDAIAPGPSRPLTLAGGQRLAPGDPIVTFVNRRFEPMRGFHTFMRALPRVLAESPQARAVLIGADAPGGYGLSAGEGTTWKARMLAELDGRLDLSRVHFTGTLPLDQMHAVMRLGSAHVYLTYPFALSWSMIEAMSLGCLVIGSRTPPVEEVLVDGVNGRLVDMLDPDAIATALLAALGEGRETQAPIRDAARRTAVERYDRRRVRLPAWLSLIDEVLSVGSARAA